MDDVEEQENREREQKARETQIKLEEEKARLRAEQQQIIMKQEQNIARLKVYFRAIEVAFHEQKENFNVTMSYMSIYHLELLENFDYYAATFEQRYRRKENSMIPLQGLFHFMKIMDLAQSTTEVVEMFQVLSDIDGVERIVDDTLNINNGLNYA